MSDDNDDFELLTESARREYQRNYLDFLRLMGRGYRRVWVLSKLRQISWSVMIAGAGVLLVGTVTKPEVKGLVIGLIGGGIEVLGFATLMFYYSTGNGAPAGRSSWRFMRQ